MLPGKTYTPDEVLRLLLKHKWMVVLPFVVGLTLAVVVASQISERYRSETLIMVMPQRISTDILPQMLSERIEDRLPSISDQILSRSRLERIIAEYDLYTEARARGAIMEDVVQNMRERDIKVSIDGRGKQSFRVAYESGSAMTAHKVTERLASLYIEENQRDRDTLAQSTNAFLDTELETARTKLLEAEKRLELYKKQYAGQLPSQADSNQQAIQGAQLQLQAISATINRARERRLLAQQQLADAQTQPAAVAILENTSGAATALTAAQQLENAEAALAAAKRRYKPDHPDIRTMERAIDDLRRKAEAEAREPQVRPSRPVTAAELARQKRIRDLEGEIAITDQQIAQSEREERGLKDTIASYQAKLGAVPTREAELIELNRGYTTLEESYKSLLKKKEESQLATNVNMRQIGETFRIIDSASLPERPFNRMRRLQVILGGALGGLVLGLAMIGFLEFRDSSFKSEEDVVRVLSLPVLAMVPLMASDKERAADRRKRLIVAGIVAVVVVVGSTAVLVFWGLQS